MHLSSHMTLWTKFRERQKSKRYKHFDRPCSLSSQAVNNYVCSPSKVAQHPFYPFIHKQIRFKKVRRHGTKIDETTLKTRDIYFCSHWDRCVFQRYSFLLSQKYESFVKENNLNTVTIAYRSLGKSNIHFANSAFNYITSTDRCFIFITDFSSFFDTLNHQLLKTSLKRIWKENNSKNTSLPDDLYTIYKHITKFSYIEKSDIDKIIDEENPTNAKCRYYLENLSFNSFKAHVKKNTNTFGIPQGSPISAVLSNIYMADFDIGLNKIVSERWHGKYMRYSDDILIAIPLTESDNINNIKSEISQYFTLNAHVAKINSKKTHSLIYYDQKFTDLCTQKRTHLDYLGFIFDGKSKRIRQRSIGKYFYRSRRKAINTGRQIERKGRRIFPRNLYDVYSTCAPSGRKNNLNNSQPRGKSNFLSYLRKAKQANILLFDSCSEHLLKQHKQRILKYIKEGKLIERRKKSNNQST